MQDALLIDKYIMDKDIQQASASASFLSKKSLRIEDQVYIFDSFSVCLYIILLDPVYTVNRSLFWL